MDDLKILFHIKCLIVIWRVCDKIFNDRFFMKGVYEFEKLGNLRQTYRAYFFGTHFFLKWTTWKHFKIRIFYIKEMHIS